MSINTLAADTFNRANSTTTMGSTDTGAKTWLYAAGSVWGINTAKAYAVSDTSGLPHAHFNPGQADYIFECDVTLSATANRASAGLIFRKTSANNNYLILALRKTATNNDIRIQKNTDGGGTAALVTQSGAGLANGATYRCKVILTGLDIVCEIRDSSSVLIATISTTLAGTDATTYVDNNCGIRLRQSATEDDLGSRFDNLLVYEEVADPPPSGTNKTNSFENGLANGTTLTTANSGYTGNDAFDVLFEGPTVTTDTTKLAPAKTRGAQCAAAATSSGTNHISGLGFTTTQNVQSWELQVYVPTGRAAYKLAQGHGADGTEAWSVVLKRNGKIQLRNRRNSQVAQTVVAVNKGTVIKLTGFAEIDPVSASANVLQVAVYGSPGATSPLETPLSVSGANIGVAGASFGQIRFGVLSPVRFATTVVLSKVAVTGTTGGPVTPTVLVDDPFTRANSTTIGQDLTGKTWTEDEGDFSISGNKLTLPTPLAVVGDLKGICEDSPSFSAATVTGTTRPYCIATMPSTLDTLWGGEFDLVGGVSRVNLVRFNWNGSAYVDAGINYQVSGGEVYGVHAVSSTLAFASGAFTSFGGSARDGLAAFNPTTGALLAHFAAFDLPGTGGGLGYDAVADALYIGRSGGDYRKITNASNSGTAAISATWLPVTTNSRGRVVKCIVWGGTDAVMLMVDKPGSPGTIEGHVCETAIVNRTTGAVIAWTNYGVDGAIDADYHDGAQILVHGSRGGQAGGGNSCVKYSGGGTGLIAQDWRHSGNGNCQGTTVFQGGLAEARTYQTAHDNAIAIDPNTNGPNEQNFGIQRCFQATGQLDQAGPRWRIVGGQKGYVVRGDEVNDRLFVTGAFTTFANWAATQTKAIERGAIIHSLGAGGTIVSSTNRVRIDPGQPDYLARIGITLSSTANRASAGLGFRRTAGIGYFVVRLDKTASINGVSLWRYVEGGNPVQLVAPSGTLANGSTYTVQVVVDNDTVTVDVAGVTTFNYTIPAAQMSTYTGREMLAWCRVSDTEDDGGSTFDLAYAETVEIGPVNPPAMTMTPNAVTTLPATINGDLTSFVAGETITFRLDNAVSGTILASVVNPSTIGVSGSATYTATIPTGTSVATHTVFAVGSVSSQASAVLVVGSVPTTGFTWDSTPPFGGGGCNSMTVTADGDLFTAEDVGGIRACFNPADATVNNVLFQTYQKGVMQEELRRKVATIVAGVTTDTGDAIVVAGFGAGQNGGTALLRVGVGQDTWAQFNTDLRFNSQTEGGTGAWRLPRTVKELLAQDTTPNGVNDLGTWYGADWRGYVQRSTNIADWTQITTGDLGRIRWIGVHPSTRDLYIGVWDSADGTTAFGLYRVTTPYTGAAKAPVRVSPSTVRTVEYGCFVTVSGVTFLLHTAAGSGTSDGVWRTSSNAPGTADFSNISGALPSQHYLSLGAYNNAGSIVAMVGTYQAGTSRALYRNTAANTGTTWTAIPAASVTHTYSGETDSGDNKWLNGNSVVVNAVKPDPSSAAGAAKRWYVQLGASWPYRSNDNGSTWKLIPDAQGAAGRGETIWSNNSMAKDPTRGGHWFGGNQDHDHWYSTDNCTTVHRVPGPHPSGVTIGHWTDCAPWGVWYGGDNDDSTNSGNLMRSTNGTTGGSTPWVVVSVWNGQRVVGGITGYDGGGTPVVVAYRDGVGWGVSPAIGTIAWNLTANTPTQAFLPGRNEYVTPNVVVAWPERTSKTTLYTYNRQASNLGGPWRINNAGASMTQLVTVNGEDIRRGYVAAFTEDTCYYTESDGNLYRIRNANSSPVIDTIAGVSDAAAIAFTTTGDLIVFVPPQIGTPGKILRATNPVPKTGTINFSDIADPADGAANDVAQESLLHVNSVAGDGSTVFAVINGASCLRGVLT